MADITADALQEARISITDHAHFAIHIKTTCS
jgi:hypothetical protein